MRSQPSSAIPVSAGPMDVSGWRHEDRGSRQAGEPLGGANPGGGATLDLHRRRHRLRYGIPLDHCQEGVRSQSVYRKYVTLRGDEGLGLVFHFHWRFITPFLR